VHTLDPDPLGVSDGHEKVLLGLAAFAKCYGMDGVLVCRLVMGCQYG